MSLATVHGPPPRGSTGEQARALTLSAPVSPTTFQGCGSRGYCGAYSTSLPSSYGAPVTIFAPSRWNLRRSAVLQP